VSKRIGVARGLFEAPGLDPKLDAEIAELFLGKSVSDDT
jgi:hypothetical protein